MVCACIDVAARSGDSRRGLRPVGPRSMDASRYWGYVSARWTSTIFAIEFIESTRRRREILYSPVQYRRDSRRHSAGRASKLPVRIPFASMPFCIQPIHSQYSNKGALLSGDGPGSGRGLLETGSYADALRSHACFWAP